MPENTRDHPGVLHENELALDVGGICWGCDEEALSVIDHHFYREGQFPSASAAVLHKAQLIREKFSHKAHDVVFLVTHTQPDFDAFCSMYLASRIIEADTVAGDWKSLGLNPGGWLDVPDSSSAGGAGRRIDWFSPDLRCIPRALRWQALLASFASHVDNSRRIACPKNRALHSVLYAAIQRGRDYLSDTSGATEFFDEVRETLQEKELNPLFDSVLEGNSRFQPELAMLDREIEAYRSDVQRARKAIVHLQKAEIPFGEFFGRLKAMPLLDEQLATRPDHLLASGHSRSQADGIYLKDPECLLFKEWARMDIENSSMGAGFTFTTVAYSNGRPQGRTNKTDYFFALDPEKADGRHLYTLWARLQSAEIRSFQKPAYAPLRQQLDEAEQRAEGTSKRTNCRPSFELRAGGYKALFNDPWFDGSNYVCTIIATPNRGTLLGEPGSRSDMLDDPVAAVVRHELEYAIYASETTGDRAQVSMVDLSASADSGNHEETKYEVAEAAKSVSAPADGYYRFGFIRLHQGVNILSGRAASQIGETLWQLLNPETGEGTPTDFIARHLLVSRDWLGIWSRRGVMIAFKPAAAQKAKTLESRFRELVSLARDVESFIEPGSRAIPDIISRGEELTRRVARVEHSLAFPDSRLLSRFFDAIKLGELLGTLHDLNLAAAEKMRRNKLDAQTEELGRNTATVAEVQTKVEWLEIFIVGFYATELAQIIVDHLRLRDGPALLSIIAVGLIFTLGTAAALRPWKHTKSKKPALLLVLLLLLSILGLLAMWKLPERFRGPSAVRGQAVSAHDH